MSLKVGDSGSSAIEGSGGQVQPQPGIQPHHDIYGERFKLLENLSAQLIALAAEISREEKKSFGFLDLLFGASRKRDNRVIGLNNQLAPLQKELNAKIESFLKDCPIKIADSPIKAHVNELRSEKEKLSTQVERMKQSNFLKRLFSPIKKTEAQIAILSAKITAAGQLEAQEQRFQGLFDNKAVPHSPRQTDTSEASHSLVNRFIRTFTGTRAQAAASQASSSSSANAASQLPTRATGGAARVQNTMGQALAVAGQRGQELENLEDKVARMGNNAQDYANEATRIRQGMENKPWWRFW